jgi:hypothetical protein
MVRCLFRRRSPNSKPKRRWAKERIFSAGLVFYTLRDPKIVADQQGHDVDVNLNVYAKTSLDRKKKAVDQLDAALLASKQSQTEPALNGSWHEVDN